MDLSSRIEVELALFNDRILSWESLIDPIVNQRGHILSPWYITCSTNSRRHFHADDQHQVRTVVD